MNQSSASGPSKLQPVRPGEAYKKRVVEWVDPEFSNNYPTLTLYLTQKQYDGGQPRQTSTLTIFVDGDGLIVVLNDRENNRSLFQNSPSLFSALLDIETALSNGDADWRGRNNAAYRKSDTPF